MFVGNMKYGTTEDDLKTLTAKLALRNDLGAMDVIKVTIPQVIWRS